MEQDKGDRVNVHVHGLGAELYRQVRIVALAQGITTSQAVAQALALWLAREVVEGRAHVELIGQQEGKG